MKILAVDTALGACSVAVLSGDTVLARRFEAMERGHAEALAPMAADGVRASGLSLEELDRLAVTTGPGTFTGQRIGLAFMRALSLALKKPLVGITTCAALAAEACARTSAGWAVAASDARRGEIYCGASLDDGSVLLEPVLIKQSDAAGHLLSYAKAHGLPALAGTAATALESALRVAGVVAKDSEVRQPDAVFVARLAAKAPQPSGAPRPLYLRAPDAKLPAAKPMKSR